MRIPAPPAGVLGGSPHSYPAGSCKGALWDKVTLVTCPWGLAAAVLPNVYETHTKTTVSVPKCVFPTVQRGLRPSRREAFGQALGRPFSMKFPMRAQVRREGRLGTLRGPPGGAKVIQMPPQGIVLERLRHRFR